MVSHFSHILLFATPWTVTHQAPLLMEFSREWVAALSCRESSLARDRTTSLTSALAGGFFTSGTTWEVPKYFVCNHNASMYVRKRGRELFYYYLS